MKPLNTKKLFAFIVASTMFFALPQFINAQRHCKPGYILRCDQNGKHCECVPFFCPPRGCGSFLGKIISSETSLISIDPNLVPKSASITFFSKEASKTSSFAFDRPKRSMKIPGESISKQREFELSAIKLE